jgi:methanogenic corrinoid protein MtbC1
MSAQPHRFSAELLERGAAGIAGYAANELLDRDPGLRERFAPDPFGRWKTHLTQRVLDLSAALAAAEPRLFVSRVLWASKAFSARNAATDDIRVSLEALKNVIEERLPPPARQGPVEYIDQALGELRLPAAPEVSELDPGQPGHRLALQYLEKILSGDTAAGLQVILDAHAGGMQATSLYLDVLLPAQREIGRLWHTGEVTVAEEHLVSNTTGRAMAMLAHAARPAVGNGCTVVVCAVASNAHDLGLRAVADLFDMAGWRAIFLGADVPSADLPAVLSYFGADLLLIGATMAIHVPRVQDAIGDIRSRCERPVKIVVGGAAFDEAPELWRRVGADGYAPSVDQAVSLGAKLVGL